jgi:hypothetical protein
MLQDATGVARVSGEPLYHLPYTPVKPIDIQGVTFEPQLYDTLTFESRSVSYLFYAKLRRGDI